MKIKKTQGCIVIKNGILPPKEYIAINLFGIILVRDFYDLDEDTLSHELIHTRQAKELLYLPFIIWYVLEFLVRLAICRNWDKAYYSICFEREAYANAQKGFEYLRQRKNYCFLKYLFKNGNS